MYCKRKCRDECHQSQLSIPLHCIYLEKGTFCNNQTICCYKSYQMWVMCLNTSLCHIFLIDSLAMVKPWMMHLFTACILDLCSNHSPLLLAHWDGKMGAILQTKIGKFNFLYGNFRQLIEISLKWFPNCLIKISQHWVRQWLGAEQLTSHYLHQRWYSIWSCVCDTR